MRALATWCVRHRRLVVLFWVGVLVVVSLISRVAGSDYSNSFSLPKTESADAINLLEAASPTVSGDVDQIVFTASGSGVRNPGVVDRINSMLAREAKVPHVSNIVSPYGPQGATHVSKDGKVAFATVTFDKQAQNLSTAIAKDLVTTAQSADTAGLQVAVSGQLAEEATRPAI